MSKGQGKGTAVTFVSASGNISGVCITDVQDGGQSVNMEDGTCMDSTAMEKIANKLIDYGTVSLSLLHDPEVNVQQLLGETGVLTITSPLTGAATTIPESETGNASLSNYSKGRPVGTLMSSTIEYTWSGDGTYTHVSES